MKKWRWSGELRSLNFVCFIFLIFLNVYASFSQCFLSYRIVHCYIQLCFRNITRFIFFPFCLVVPVLYFLLSLQIFTRSLCISQSFLFGCYTLCSVCIFTFLILSLTSSISLVCFKYICIYICISFCFVLSLICNIYLYIFI